MSDDLCDGCGVPLQSDQPDAPGYVPAHVAQRGSPLLCRRCFRINHYGQETENSPVDGESALGIVLDVVERVDACLVVVDILDFEGSFVEEIMRAAAGKLVVAVNKVDLLPSKTPSDEVASWVKARLDEKMIKYEGVYCVSAATGFGVRVLLDAVRAVAGKNGEVGLVGATNVGKSTLLSKWLKGEQGGPTVSRFPGTTIGVVGRTLDGLQMEILDTPGLVTRGRMTDILCRKCAAAFVPDASISSKLLRLGPQQGVAFDGLSAVVPVGAGEETVVLAFAAGGTPVERLREDKLDRWLGVRAAEERQTICGECKQRLDRSGWEVVETHVDEMEDVVIHGLGWLSPRRKGIRVRVTVPAGALVSTRPRLIGPKEPRRERGR